MQSQLAERRIPEMVVPLQGTDRSRGLLSQAAIAIGSQSTRGRMEGQQPLVSVNAPITVTVNGAPVGQEGAVAREVKRAMETIHVNYLKSCGSRILERRRVVLARYRSCNYGTRTDQ